MFMHADDPILKVNDRTQGHRGKYTYSKFCEQELPVTQEVKTTILYFIIIH